jgi:hypothetical protein
VPRPSTSAARASADRTEGARYPGSWCQGRLNVDHLRRSNSDHLLRPIGIHSAHEPRQLPSDRQIVHAHARALLDAHIAAAPGQTTAHASRSTCRASCSPARCTPATRPFSETPEQHVGRVAHDYQVLWLVGDADQKRSCEGR